jgi:Rab-like protein 2
VESPDAQVGKEKNQGQIKHPKSSNFCTERVFITCLNGKTFRTSRYQGKCISKEIILLGDSAVGKSKLMERFLMDDYIPHQSSTYALTLYRYRCEDPTEKNKKLEIDFWDTAGQERFQSMHSSYYHGAHCCILVFDITRKITFI